MIEVVSIPGVFPGHCQVLLPVPIQHIELDNFLVARIVLFLSIHRRLSERQLCCSVAY